MNGRDDDVAGAAASERGADFERRGMRAVMRVESRGGRVYVRWPDGREVVALRPRHLRDGVLAVDGGRLVWLRGEEARAAWRDARPRSG